MNILVDSNVILDILTEDPTWYDWSAGQLEQLAEENVFWINPLIYAEVSVRFKTIEELEDVLGSDAFRREALPWEAAFLAGKCFVKYKRTGGARTSTLPDFYIGAHAAVRGMQLLTRDAKRYRTYFPKLSVIAPKG